MDVSASLKHGKDGQTINETTASAAAPGSPAPVGTIPPTSSVEVVDAPDDTNDCHPSVISSGEARPDVSDLKIKQLKTKVSERVRKDDSGNVISTCWDVQVGSALLKVYFTPIGKRELFTVSYWVDGKRKREVLPTFKAAISAAKKTGESLGRGDLGGAELSGRERVACSRALQLLAPTGVPIEMAASEYAHVYQLLNHQASVTAAVEFYLKRNPVAMVPKRVSDLINECLASKAQDRLSERYLRQLEYDLRRFEKKFKGYIVDLAGRDIDKWLRDLGVSGRTRNNIRMSVQTLFGFAKSKLYLPKDHDEMDAVPVAKEVTGAIEIFTPAEMMALLKAAGPGLVPFLAIGGFAGVRHAEIQRLDWKDVRFDAGIIEIHAGNAKTATRRTVPIVPNLRAWLKQYQKESGPVCPFANVVDRIETLLAKMNDDAAASDRSSVADDQSEDDGKKFKWKHNGLRHSFISYRVAKVKNVAQVALEAGNSPAVIFSNYRELVTPKDAKAWFAIMPPGANGKPAK